MNKYRNKKITVGGNTFDSKKEAHRYQELGLLQRAGKISNLRLQSKFVLIPTQYAKSSEVYKKGPSKGLPKQGKLIEKECAYYADFVYDQDGQTVVEDVKGVKTKEYIIKRKLFKYKYPDYKFIET